MLDIIYIHTLDDVETFRLIFDSWEDVNILENPDRDQVTDLLQRSNNPLMVIGHGDQCGVYGSLVTEENGNQVWGEYCLDCQHVDLLRQRIVIGIWCYAGNFADIYGLHGFFTSMFISNINEAIVNGFDTTEDNVRFQNGVFALQIRSLIEENIPMNEWVERLQSNCNNDIPFVRFNYEAMSYYE